METRKGEGYKMKRKYTKRVSTATRTSNTGTLENATKVESTTLKHFVDGVEYATIPDTLRKKNVAQVLGYKTDVTYSGTPIYSYVQYHRNRFTSYVSIGTLFFFPATEIEAVVDEYLEMFESRKNTQSLTPDTSELLRRLREKPELATALLELIA
jgi:hypothetical protein